MIENDACTCISSRLKFLSIYSQFPKVYMEIHFILLKASHKDQSETLHYHHSNSNSSTDCKKHVCILLVSFKSSPTFRGHSLNVFTGCSLNCVSRYLTFGRRTCLFYSPIDCAIFRSLELF